MTAVTSTALPPMDNVARSTTLTRKSIKKYFPLGAIMSKGCSNPVTVHSVNEELFPRLWSFIAEVMIVQGELTRSTKETIALMVSSKNQCPMCVTAHRMMGAAAKRAENTKDQAKHERQLALHNAAMDYAETLIDKTMRSKSIEEDDMAMDESFSYDSTASSQQVEDPILSPAAKSEVAMVVILYNHMNRIISAVLGEQMSAAMFSVPRPAAKRMESTSVMSVVNKMMAPVLAGGMSKKHSSGITSSLFPVGSSCLGFLPDHLKGVELAGEERAEALARLVAWTALYEMQILEEGIVSPEVMKLLDDPRHSPPDLRPHITTRWATIDMRKTIDTLPDKTSRAIASVLLLVSYTPQSVFNSIHWKTLLKTLGSETSKTLVIWWSLRFTVRRAKGLRLPKEQQPGWD